MHIWYCSVAGHLPYNPHCNVSAPSLSPLLFIFSTCYFHSLFPCCRVRKQPKQEKYGKFVICKSRVHCHGN